MSRKTRRAGAFASAATLFAALFAVHGTGALAQSESQVPIILAVAAAIEPAASATNDAAAASTSEIRFVSTPVVQDLTAPAAPAGEHGSLHALVAATPSEGELAGELKCLAQAIYFEARGEPLAGQLAVARVIINRSESPQFPSDYCAVVTQRGQFSFVRGGRIPSAPEGSAAWARAVSIARIAHQDLWPSDADDALFFHASYVRPAWAGRKTARATIDRHIFYR